MKKMGTFPVYLCIFLAAMALTDCRKAPTGAGAEGDKTGGAAAAAAEFGYPAAGEPWYYVKCALETPALPAGLESEPWSVDRVTVDGTRCRDFLVYQDGREVDKLGVKAAGGRIALAVKARYMWRPEAETSMKVELVEPKSGDIQIVEAAGRAPSGTGYWNPAWKSYLSLVVSEDHGFARTGYPVHATLGVLADYLRSPDEVRVVKAEWKGAELVYREIPSQVYDVVTWNDPKVLGVEEIDAKTGEKVVRYHPTTSFSVAFLAEVGANAKATYIVFYNNPAAPRPAYATDLSVTKGRGLGRTVENGFYKIALHETSGVIHEIVEKSTATMLEHKLETNGAIHWNPDVYAPPHAWYHSSDWTNPEAQEAAGPVFYSLNLKGRLPQPAGVDIGIRYHFYAGSPVVMVESITTVAEDTFVMALRNAEV
ncbi:MAG: hypothetical protein H6P95_1386, partial [Candidatus Aminicenantes bacterium]|nr:hypothetical protein [Candidatus Aminicenantes bacterium]